MIDMTASLNDHYFWITASFILSGAICFVVGFLTCFFYCNYQVIKTKGGHCGICGDWIPDELFPAEWAWGICDKHKKED